MEEARLRWAHLLPPAAASALASTSSTASTSPPSSAPASASTASSGAGAKAARTRPYVTVTYAQSIDGSIASAQRVQLPLSGSGALAMTHCLRASHDAILVGVGTVAADNPKLSARIPVRSAVQPQPLIIDPRLDMPLDGYLLTDADAVRPWIFCHAGADAARRAVLEATGARVVPCTTGDGARLDLGEVLERAAAAGIRSVMVEGGARILGSFLQAPHLVDRVVVTIAPVYVGGLSMATGLVGPVHPLQTMPDAVDLGDAAPRPAAATMLERRSGSFFHRLRDVRHEIVDGDIVLSGRL